MRVVLGLAGLMALAACSADAPRTDHDLSLTASVETVRVASSGDAADDPAVWIAPDAGFSLILGTDKQAGLYTYSLSGEIEQFLPAGRLNNVDVRYDFPLPGPRRDIAIASDRTQIGIAVFLIDPDTRQLEAWPVIALNDVADPYGACLYRSSEGGFYAFVTDKDPGTVVQLLLRYDGEGVISGEEVRRFSTGSTTEGCVADDRTGMLYLAEENRSIWRISAEPDGGDTLHAYAPVDGQQLTADVEGLAVLPRGERGGWLIASSQGDSAYAVYDLESGEPVSRFRIVDGDIDGTSHTDGLDVSTAPLGEAFPAGVIVVQDDENDHGGQNFKLVDARQLVMGLTAAE